MIKLLSFEQAKFLIIFGNALYCFFDKLTEPFTKPYFIKGISAKAFAIANASDVIVTAGLLSILSFHSARVICKKHFGWILMAHSILFAIFNWPGLFSLEFQFIGWSFLAAFTNRVWDLIMLFILYDFMCKDTIAGYHTKWRAIGKWGAVAGSGIAVAIITANILTVQQAILLRVTFGTVYALSDFYAALSLQRGAENGTIKTLEG